MITKEDLEAAGYQKYARHPDNYLMQKRVEDEVGVKYYIEFYAFGVSMSSGEMLWEPEVQFGGLATSHRTVNMTYVIKNHMETSLSEVEEFFESAWEFMGSHYYKKNAD